MLKLLKLFWWVKEKNVLPWLIDLIMFTVWSTYMIIHVTLRICYMQFVIILCNKYSAWACLIFLRFSWCLICAAHWCQLINAKLISFQSALTCGTVDEIQLCHNTAAFLHSLFPNAQFVWVKCRTWWGKTRERERKRDLLSFNFSPFIKEGINRGEFSTAFQWGEVLSVKGLVWFKLAWETRDRFTWKAARGLSVNNSLPVYFCLSRI